MYQSSNPQVASIDKNAIITLKAKGDFEIKVKVNPVFYLSDETISYKYKSLENKTGAFIQDMHIGQSSILPATSAYNQLVANKETLIRLFVYSHNKQQIMPASQLLFRRTNGEQFIKDLTCPPHLKQGVYSLPDYSLKNSCYAIMQTQTEQKFIEQGVQIKAQVFAENATLTKSIAPKVAPKAILNLYLVKGKIERKNSQGAVLEAYTAEISPQDQKLMRSFLQSAFPLSEVNIRLRKEPLQLDANLRGALAQMQKIQDYETKNGEFAYALVPEFYAFGDGGKLNGLGSGLSKVNGGPSVGRSKNAINTSGGKVQTHLKILAHELGHAFGLYHAPCGPGNVEQVFDSFWKQNPQAWQHANKGLLSESPIYVSEQKTLVSPVATRFINRNPFVNAPADLMGYCDGYRLSKHNYKFSSELISAHRYFRAASQGANFQARSASGNLSGNLNKIIIRGKLLEGENKILLKPVIITSAQPIPIKGKDFGYAAWITTANGTFVYPLNFVQLDHENSRQFELILPDVGTIKKLEFMQHTNLIKYKIEGLSQAETAAVNFKDFSNLATKSPITYNKMTATINWDSKYKFMSAVFHTFDNKQLLVDKAVGNAYTIPKNLPRGFIQISLSDGLNTYIESFFTR